jgi:hypothetical protein
MSGVVAPKPRNLQIEIKLPNEAEHHFLQIHSTTAIITLKSKIFRKSGCLEGEKPDNYVLALKQDTKMDVLAEDKLIGAHPWIEAESNSNFFTIYVISKQEKQESLKRKNSFTRLSMHDDSSRFLLPLPSVSIQSPTRQPISSGRKSTGEEESKGATPKIARSRSEPILRPTRSLGSMSELTSDFDILSNQSSDVESLDEDDDSVGSHSNTAHDDAAQLSPKVKLRERSSTAEKLQHKKISLSGSFVGKDSPVGGDKHSNKKKGSLWSLFPKREEVESKSKHRKHASMIITRSDSGTFQPGSLVPIANKNRSASFEADPPALQKTGSAVHPVPADYSLKRANSMLVVEEDGGKIVLTAGTVEQLICCLADRDIPDAAYLDEFFYSMSYFTNGSGLMAHLRKRYEYPVPEDATQDIIADYDKWRPVIQQRVLNVIRYIIENHWYHIERDDNFLPLMKEFVESSGVKQNNRAKSLRELINSRMEAGKDTLRRIGRAPPTASGSHNQPEKTNDGANTGSTDLAVHGRSNSSPIIVWRARRDTLAEQTGTNSPSTQQPASSTTHEDPAIATPTSLTTVPSATNAPPPKPLGKRFKDYRKVSFTRVHPMEMARQLTLIEKELFRAIRPPELVGAAYKKKKQDRDISQRSTDDRMVQSCDCLGAKRACPYSKFERTHERTRAFHTGCWAFTGTREFEWCNANSMCT